ncbi:GNAT family N-acetyltransferase [Streptomyces boncukensis]|uniref:GNAT family N-acetyltransferase n=1 Tax=Streptomyces boncukensis TaxID=2711219 RepID=A0A6G4X251_9ACTN|nr:GNAT family protein [Streptomyces boncukensis]NGO71333.1 GNAT family N-acetyltransferase [Streptomyces boncukensis]
MPSTIRTVGDLIAIREFAQSDVEDVRRVVGDDRVTRWLSHDSRGKEETRAMVERITAMAAEEPRTDYSLAVVAPPSDRVIGFCRIGLSGIEAGKLGYAIAYDDWGKGYATDTARTMVDLGFRKLGLHRISAAIGPDNTASQRVVEKLGFTKEGTLRDHVFTNGAWRDSVLYSLLQPEWANIKQ